MNVEAKIDALFERHEIIKQKVKGSDCIHMASMDSPIDEEQLNELQLYLRSHFAELVGALIYISITCRPDISCAVGLASKGMHGPQKIHLLYLEGLLRYLKKHKDLKLVYKRGNAFRQFARTLSQAYPEMGELHNCPIVGLSDANFAPPVKAKEERMRSTSGRCFFVFNFLVSWSSKRQSLTPSSTMQAELIAASAASDMGIWFYNLSCSLPFVFGPSKAIPLLLDNLAALSVANHPKHDPATRHICLREFRIRDAHEFGQVRPYFCPGAQNCADHFTKLLDTVVHSRLLRVLGMEGQLKAYELPGLVAAVTHSKLAEFYNAKELSESSRCHWDLDEHRAMWIHWTKSGGSFPSFVLDDTEDLYALFSNSIVHVGSAIERV